MSICKFLENAASKYENREALSMEGQTLTYRQLDEKAVRIANALRETTLIAGDCVALYLEKSPDAISAIFGVLKIGATYVPIDYSAHIDKAKEIFRQCKIKTVIATSREIDKLTVIYEKTGFPKWIILTDMDILKTSHSSFPKIMGRCQINAQNTKLDYHTRRTNKTVAILFTSGSTGNPKGVIISDENVLTFTRWAVQKFSITSEDRIAGHAPLFFDISLFDVFAVVTAGACMEPLGRQHSNNPRFLLKWMTERKITIWQSVSSILSMMAQFGKGEEYDLSCLRHILFTGERLPVKFLKILMDFCKNADFHNIYGCTETNDTFCYTIDRKNLPAEIPIGKAIPYVRYMVVDKKFKPVVSGKQGELLIKSPTNTPGYWKEELPVCQTGGENFFPTRDIVIELPDGNLQLLGRSDNIVKSRGYRIPLLHIERCLLEHPKIDEAAVIAFADEFISNKLIAIVFSEQEKTPSVVALKIYCAKVLPAYMIPDILEISEKRLEKTASGKIDKQRLLEKYKKKSRLISGIE